MRPPFFVENQEGMDPHASLDPLTSARIVISHVADGLELARRYRLPFRIQDIIAQHHGTRVVRSFYRRAQEAAGEGVMVDMDAFRYPGPRPVSREAAIVMLADAIDATSTAVRPNTEKAIEKLINTIVEDDIVEGQLNRSGLSLNDIEQLRLSFIETLKGRFHVRVQYPGPNWPCPRRGGLCRRRRLPSRRCRSRRYLAPLRRPKRSERRWAPGYDAGRLEFHHPLSDIYGLYH